ncbi:MAG: helix-turn-helix transcriptional regulator [Lachnospiraceae bacterium]|nr:helix-turn-helix transcriptional regulator [Lachnospiraceae bacterium]
MDQQKIGTFIAEVRKKKSFTQSELADRIGVTNKTVSRWETGKYMPDLATIQSLCKELDISVGTIRCSHLFNQIHVCRKPFHGI